MTQTTPRKAPLMGKAGETDALLASRFGELAARAAAGELARWEDDPRAPGPHPALLDQLPRPSPPPRRLRPGRQGQGALPQGLTLRGSTRALAAGRVFFYLPLEHASPKAAGQKRRPVRALADEQITGPDHLRRLCRLCPRHQVIVDRFGRFPTATPSWAGRARRKRPPSCNSPVRGSDIKNPAMGMAGKLNRSAHHWMR